MLASKDAEWGGGQRMCDPRHHPDAPASIVRVDAAETIDIEGDGIGETIVRAVAARTTSVASISPRERMAAYGSMGHFNTPPVQNPR